MKRFCKWAPRWATLYLLVAALFPFTPLRADEKESALDAAQIFQQRILPIFHSPRPSSCTECHLQGVELRDYIRPSQAETFAALRAANLIDTEHPEKSKILEFIDRRPAKSSLVTEKIRKQELSAFRQWIVAAVQTPALLDSEQNKSHIGPQLPPEVVRHARRDRVLASFIDNVWTEVGRCAACHSPDKNNKQVEEYGERVSWIQLDDPQATLDYMLKEQLISTESPAESLLIQKPTLQLDHGGGQKMVVGDRTYKQFMQFLTDYSTIAKGEYKAVEQLPSPSAEISVVSDIWLKIEEVPEEYDQMLLQVDLFKWDDDGWGQQRVATSDRPVFGKGRLWQHSLSLTAPRGEQPDWWAASRLPAGRYLARIYIDRAGKLQQNPTLELDDDSLVAEVEMQSDWQPGYGRMSVIEFPAK